MDSSWRDSSKVIISSDDEFSADEGESNGNISEDESVPNGNASQGIFTSDEDSPKPNHHRKVRNSNKSSHTPKEDNNSPANFSKDESESNDSRDESKTEVSNTSALGDSPAHPKGKTQTKHSVNSSSSSKHSGSSSENTQQPKIIYINSVQVHSKNLIPERQTEILNAKKYYELELLKEKSRLDHLKSTAKAVKINTLPDNGAKLRSSIEKQIEKVKVLNEQLSFVSSNIVHSQAPGPSKFETTAQPLSNIIDLTRDRMDLSEMGKRALATHQAQQSQTVKTLEKLHEFLGNSDSKEEASDPISLKVPLLPHQKIGLSWLIKRECAVPRGGILADDMGLGKTLTIISLILKDMENNISDKNDSSGDEVDSAFMGRKKLPDGKTLIICPSSVVGQWASEVTSKVKGGTLSVYTHHGNKRETNPRNIARYDIVLTTYTILQHDNKEEPGPLLSVYWKRVVLDEAHIIRNYKSKTAQAVFAIRARRRWALTGTPIHNKQDDYFSLLKFLRCKPFDDLAIWKKMVDNRSDYGRQRLHLLTKSLLFRRTKEEIQKEGGLKGLKSKNFYDIQVKLDPEEFKVYEKVSHFSSALLAQYIHEKAEKENLLEDGLDIKRKGPTNPFNDHPELGRLYNQMLKMKGGVQTHHILVLLLRLRQICCHLSLITSFIDSEEIGLGQVEDNAGNDVGLLDQMMNLSIVAGQEDLEEPSRKILSSDDPVFRKDRCSSKIREVINCITDILEEGDDKIIIVSQWTSVLEIINSFLKKIEIKSVSLNGTIPVKNRIGIIEDFNNNQRGPKVLLLSLTAGGTGLNLVGANRLILVDVHWNPQLEAQACDRIYRVGQNKMVHVYKFVCSNTIEERIVKLQQEKLQIAKGVLTGTSIQSAKLTLSDLKELFNIK